MPRLVKPSRRSNERWLAMQAEQAHRYYDVLYHRHMVLRGVVADDPPKYEHRRRRDGNTIWVTLAQLAQRQHTSTQVLIAVLFAHWSGREPPRPHHAMSHDVLAHLPDFRAAAIEVAQIQLNTDRRTYEQQMQLARAYEVQRPRPRSEMQLAQEVLANDVSQLSPLFRYSVARQLQLVELAREVRAEADAQFIGFPPAYLETAWLPLLAKRHSVVMAAQYGSEAHSG